MSVSLGKTSIPGIKIEAPNGSSQTFPVEYDIVLVGSGDRNNIILRDAAIDSDHLQIDFEPEYVVATDLQSQTGTIIGITQLDPHQPTIWPHDQTLYIGPFKLSLTQIEIEELDSPSAGPASALTEPPSGAALHTEITSIIVEAGSPEKSGAVDVPYLIINESEETDRFSLQISGIPQEWLADLPQVMLAPGSQTEVVVRYRIPALSPNSLGNYPIEIRAYSEHNDYRSQPLHSTLTITPNTSTTDFPSLMPDRDDSASLGESHIEDTYPPQEPLSEPDEETENEPVVEELIIEEPIVEEPAFEEPVVEESTFEEPSEQERWSTQDDRDFGWQASGFAAEDDPQDDWLSTPRADEVDISTDDEHSESDRETSAPDDAQTYAPDAFTTASRHLAYGATSDESSTDESTFEQADSTERYPDPPDRTYAPPEEAIELSVRQFKQDGSTDSFGITKDQVMVGSGDDDDIRIDEVGVLPHHIQLHVDDDDQVYVIPRHETPGVFIGRTKAPEGEQSLWDADKILQIGPFLRLGLEKSTTAASLVELYPNGPQDWTIGGGRDESTSYIVANLGKRSDRFQLDLQGVPPEVLVDSDSIELAPGTKGELSANFSIPAGMTARAGDRPIQVRAVGVSYGNESNPLPAVLKILPIRSFRTSLEPRDVRLNETIRLSVENQGNEVQSYQATWHDIKDALAFTPEYHDFVLGPGESDSVSINTDYQGNRPFFGNRKYPFKATITPESGERVVKEGEVTGHGCLPWWIFVFPLLCFICAAIPALVQSRLNWGIDIPGIDLPAIELPGFLADILGDDVIGDGPGDLDVSNDGAIPSADQASANATRNASAYATAAAEVTAAADLVIAATNSWLELDDDADGLTNGQELEIGSQVDKRDTDEDGIVDGEEVNKWLTNPISQDSDADGLNDLDEVRRNLDPRNPDTDGDGTLDGRDQAPGQAPTPTPDATKTAVAIQRATAQAGCYVDTGFDTLNLRSGPGEAYDPPLVKLPNGAWLQPIAYRYPGDPEGEWIEVQVRGTQWQGWVSREWIKCNIDITQLSAGELPATATSTSAATATPVNTVALATASATATALSTSTAVSTETSVATSVRPIVEPVPIETSTPVAPIATATPTSVGGGDGASAPEPTQPPDADLADIEDVYAALELVDVATDKALYTSGEPILLTYGLQNISGQQIKVPQPEPGAQPLVGMRQHWVERIGDDSSIPSLAESDKTGTQYRFRNEIIQATILLPDNLISTQQTLDTTGFPSGDYLITVGYRKLDGELSDSEVVAFVIE